MKITELQIYIIPREDLKEQDEPKTISMTNGVWTLPSRLYPREVRFIAALEELVTDYNRSTR